MITKIIDVIGNCNDYILNVIVTWLMYISYDAMVDDECLAIHN